MRNLYSPEIGDYLEIPDKALKIISLTPSVTETLIEMNLKDRLVGISSWCKALIIAKKYQQDLLKIPVAGSYDSVNPDIIRKADLVIFSGGYQRILVEKLKELHVPFYVAQLPKSIWGIGNMILQIAAAVNEIELGVKLGRKFLRSIMRAMNPSLFKIESKVYVELNLGELVIPGFFSHIINGLEVIGVKTINSSFMEPYIIGDRALRLSKSLAKASSHIIYEDHSIRPNIEELREKVSERYGVKPEKVIVLPSLTLTDYGPRFPESLEEVREALLSSLF